MIEHKPSSIFLISTLSQLKRWVGFTDYLFFWVLLLPVMVFDVAITTASAPILVGWLDPFAHGLLGLALSLPLIRKHGWKWGFIGVLVSILLDVDHAVMAGSLDINAMISLPGRPFSHSFLFAFALSFLISIINTRAGGLVLLVLLGHILRDTSSGTTPLFFPWDWQPWAPWLYWACLPLLYDYACLSARLPAKSLLIKHHNS